MIEHPSGSGQASRLSEREMHDIDAYWRAANYLTIGQIYLLDNPLLREPLRLEHVKPRLLGHWGTSPGLSFIYAHLNRAIRLRDENVIYVCGPGHGGPAMVANTYLEGTYSELNPDISMDELGLRKLFRQFSFPGGIPSHAAPDVPGSINEGGELGYSLSHAYGAAFDNPDLVVACVVGDGEAETGPLAAAWHSNKFLNPVRDGAVLPILHLNGYKIANPTILARIPEEELRALFIGYGYEPLFVEGHEPALMHQRMATVIDDALDRIGTIQRDARDGAPAASLRPKWPMIVLRTPKGWTGPKEVDGLKTEGFWRSHQVPLSGLAENPAHLKLLEEWLKSYRPEELFDTNGAPVAAIRATTPQATRRMSANPHANGGLLRRSLDLPALHDHSITVEWPGAIKAESTRVMGAFLRDVMRLNQATKNFRIVGPDETASNRLQDVFDVTERGWMEKILPEDVHLGRDGRVLEILSEHTCQGWLEGYLLTGRHGFFSCYEAFTHIIDSMFNQHAKWLDACRKLPWRQPVASLNYLLSSHVWHQEHNGFSHQDPGFIDVALNKKADVVRVYLPPDANSLLCVTDHVLKTWNRINVIVAGKALSWQWLPMDDAIIHCNAGIGIWEWASTDRGAEPDVVMACAGDVPTLETLAAVQILKHHAPDLRIRVVNAVDLMTLQPKEHHPHGLSDRDFDALFTKDKPVIFAYHGYPWTIHRLTYRRTNHDNIHVRGYNEEGTTTTPFDMTVLNGLDRYHLVLSVLDRLPEPTGAHVGLKQAMEGKLVEHRAYIRAHGQDMPEILGWAWEQ
ncbi:phosphoketolase family protein [Mesorhizobium sp. M0491]|uniref:phosphoketolase family protein n=1 Tax=Mesorhizobium sp. M0491 TaxID=2956950 RepID=UPI00333903E4